MDTRIPELLRSLADEVSGDRPNDPRLARATLRRAARRRALTASGAVLAVTALLVGGVLGVRAFEPSSGITPAHSPEPSPIVPGAPAFEGIWPETTAAELETAQQAVDEGHSPWQLDPGQTAVAFATNLLGWSYDTTSSRVVQLVDATAAVRISTSALGPRVPPITVVLWQLGQVGPSGVWTVVKVGTPLLDEQVTPYPLQAGADATVSGRLTQAFDGSTLRVDLLAGLDLESSVAGGDLPLAPGFEWTGPVPSGSLGDVTVLVRNVDATGMALGASAFAVPVTGSSSALVPTDTATSSETALAKVDRTRETILTAARNHDIPALASLVAPRFAYNFDTRANPIVAWKEDPTVLDTLAKILEMPPAKVDGGTNGTLHVWPYLSGSDLTNLSEAERTDLASLGITPQEVASMIQGFGSHGYVGPRAVIASDGTWLSFTTGGD